MKKIFFIASAFSILITQTGCFGSFSAIKKVYEFNDSVDDKFVKTLLFYVLNIIPVYGVAGFLDAVIFNLIEFWTGSNPIAMELGQMEEQLITLNGEIYKVTATQNKMVFAKIDGTDLVDMGAVYFDSENYVWNFEKDGEVNKLASFDPGNNQVNYYSTKGVKSIDAASIECLVKEKMNTVNSLAVLTE
ncbi:MAG: hypothetical protein ACJASF_002310 [Vicingaceae bacterium]|jgi:hypothetical protein